MQAVARHESDDPLAGHAASAGIDIGADDDLPTLTSVHDDESADDGIAEAGDAGGSMPVAGTGRDAPASTDARFPAQDAAGSPFGDDAAPDPVDESMSLARHPLAGMSVLIIDRSRASRMELRDLITDLGAAQVIDADGIEPATLTLRMQPVHLIVSEYMLQDGDTAQTLMERLREAKLLPLSTMFVVISAERSSRSVAAVAEFGPDAYMIKPLVRHDVRMRLARASHRKRALYELHSLVETDRLDEAADEALRVGEQHPPLHSEALRLVTGRLVAAGRLDAAEKLVRAALERHRYPWALYRLAELRFHASRYDDAARLLNGLIERHPDHLAAYELLARIREMRGQFDAALECLDQVAGRSVHTVGRLRRTGALARRIGDLRRAESSYAQVMQRTRGESVGSAEDTVNLVQVLMARGKTEQAERITREQTRRSGNHPDALIAEAMLAFTRARQAGRRDDMIAAMDAVVRAVEKGGGEVSMSLGLQVLENCVEESLRAPGYRCALAMVRSRRADRPVLNRLRALVEELSHTPAHLLDPADIPLSLQRLASEGWDHHLGPVIADSIEHWQRLTPGDTRLPGWRGQLTALARPFGVLQYG